MADLISPFSRAECIRRLEESIGGEWTSMGMKGIVVGGTTETSFCLNKKYNFRNDLKTYLFGKLIEEGTTTRIRYRAGLPWYVYVIGSVISITLLSAAIQNRTALPLVGFAFFGAIFGIARFAQQYDFGFLLAFVKQVLQASEPSPQPQKPP
jgi:hypothetical protein